MFPGLHPGVNNVELLPGWSAVGFPYILLSQLPTGDGRGSDFFPMVSAVVICCRFFCPTGYIHLEKDGGRYAARSCYTFLGSYDSPQAM